MGLHAQPIRVECFFMLGASVLLHHPHQRNFLQSINNLQCPKIVSLSTRIKCLDSEETHGTIISLRFDVIQPTKLMSVAFLTSSLIKIQVPAALNLNEELGKSPYDSLCHQYAFKRFTLIRSPICQTTTCAQFFDINKLSPQLNR